MQTVENPPASTLHESVLCAPRRRASSVECLAIWRALLEQETRIVAHLVAYDRSHLILRARADGEPAIDPSSRLRARNCTILERVLLGASAKAVAIDFGLSASAVATLLKRALGALGLEVVPSLAPPSLVALVRTALGQEPELKAERATLSLEGQEYEVMSVPLPAFAGLVSPAVADVLALRAQGRTYAEIAARRGTSTRTVANQINSAFRRLRISRRTDLFGPLEARERLGSGRP